MIPVPPIRFPLRKTSSLHPILPSRRPEWASRKPSGRTKRIRYQPIPFDVSTPRDCQLPGTVMKDQPESSSPGDARCGSSPAGNLCTPFREIYNLHPMSTIEEFDAPAPTCCPRHRGKPRRWKWELPPLATRNSPAVRNTILVSTRGRCRAKGS